MRCISPIRIKNPALSFRKRTENPYLDVPCSKCGNCLTTKANRWSFRLSVEEKHSESAYFITLTYDNETLAQEHSLDEYPSVNKRDLQLFIKKVRKYQSKHFPKAKKIKYYAVSEYGELKGRPHYHMIIFNLTMNTRNQLGKIWANGGVDVKPAVRETINYVTYYVFKKMSNQDLNSKLGRAPEFALMSKNLGIGYLENKKYHVQNETFLAVVNGQLAGLPPYYRKKMFSDTQVQNIQKKYAKITESEYQKAIEKQKALGKRNPEYAVEINKFEAQRLKLEKLKKDKL